MSDNDPVAAVLRKQPLTNEQRADLWDAFEAATDTDDLAARLATLKAPDAVKSDLWDMKAASSPAHTPAPASKVAAPPPTPQPGQPSGGAGIPQADVLIGMGKSVGELGVGAGRALQMIPGVTPLTDAVLGQGRSTAALDAAQAYLKPANATQAMAKTATDVAQFFAPIPGVGKAKAAIAAKDAGLTYLQTGSIPAAAASAGLSAVMPGANAVANAAGRLKIGAEKTVAQALGATKEWAKSDAAKLARPMLDRGIKGTREGMLEQATAKAIALGKSLDDAYDAAEAAGQTIGGNPVRTGIQTAIDGFHVVSPAGKRIPIAGTETVVQKLGALDDFVAKLGPDIPIKQARAVRQAWDKIVDDAGMYGQHAAANATDKAAAWAAREGASAFKQLINATPDIGALNKEIAFWIKLKDVLGETIHRTQAQGGGLTAAIAGTVGGGVGMASGENPLAAFGLAAGSAAAGRGVVKVLQHPYFRTAVSAPLKDKLADALASGSAGQVQSAVHAITQALKAAPAQVHRALAQ